MYQPGRIDVRAEAEIHEVAQTITGELLTCSVLDQFDFQILAFAGEKLDSLFLGDYAGLIFKIPQRQLPHLRLDLRQIVLGEVGRAIEIVEESIADRRSDPKVRTRKERADRRCHQV